MDSINDPSAQGTEVQPQEPQNTGFQARIDELTAKYRQSEENEKRLQAQLLEAATKQAEFQAEMLRRQTQPQAAPIAADPLAPFRDQLEPTAVKALDAMMKAQNEQYAAQLAQIKRQTMSQQAVYNVRQVVQSTPGVDQEVAQRAEQLFTGWAQQGLPYTPEDALNFALGEQRRKSLFRAAPVMHLPQNGAPPVTPGGQQPQAPRTAPVLPSNFDALPRHEQNNLLEKSGRLDDAI